MYSYFYVPTYMLRKLFPSMSSYACTLKNMSIYKYIYMYKQKWRILLQRLSGLCVAADSRHAIPALHKFLNGKKKSESTTSCWVISRQPDDTHSLLCHVRLVNKGARGQKAKQQHRAGWYDVATISRLLKIIGLYCRILSLLLGSFAKETYNFKEPTNCSHPISSNIRYTFLIVSCKFVEWRGTGKKMRNNNIVSCKFVELRDRGQNSADCYQQSADRCRGI